MAHSSFSLPAFTVTRRNKTGSRAVSYIHRTFPSHQTESSASHNTSEDCACDHSSGFDPVVFDDTLSVGEPTGYELERKAAIAGLEKIHQKLKSAIIEASGMCMPILVCSSSARFPFICKCVFRTP